MDKVETLLQNNYEALSSLRGLCLGNIVNANVWSFVEITHKGNNLKVEW